jgi:hypothetical protein
MLPNFVGTVFEAPCIQQSRPMVPIELPEGRIDSGLGLNPAIVMLEEGGFRFVLADDERSASDTAEATRASIRQPFARSDCLGASASATGSLAGPSPQIAQSRSPSAR